MSMNGKTKTVKTGNQDYMNLLNSISDSDSDDKIPDLKLPPIKGKKQRRRKGGSVRQEESICNIWTLFKSIFVLLCLISFIILSGLSFWSLQRINDLQQQLSILQTSDKETPDMIMKLQTQISMLNKTVLELKQGMDVLESNLKLMSQRLNSTEESNKELKLSVSASKDYLDTPDKLKVLTNTVASMGSDQTKIREDHDKRLAALEAAKVSATQMPENIGSQTLRLQLEELQKTVEEEIGNYTQEITLHSTQISQLENLLKSLSGQTGVATYPPGSIVEKGEFLAFKEDTLSNIQKTNQTLFTLSDEFDALAVRLTIVDDAIINITSVLNTIKRGDDKEKNFSAPEQTTDSITQAEAVESKTLHSDRIKDLNELNKLYEEMSTKGQKVDEKTLKLNNFHGDEEAFKAADTDEDQHYSIEELAKALNLPKGSMRCQESETEDPKISTEAKTSAENLINWIKKNFGFSFCLSFSI